MNIEEVIQQIQRSAEEKGADSTKLISARSISVSGWVRLKCEYGCKGYARHFTCPPYSPTPEETRQILACYKKALIIEFVELCKKEE